MVKFFIKTYGCQANVADSYAVSDYLKNLGCMLVESEAYADLVLINTCAVREKAEQRFFSYLGALIIFKKNNPNFKVGIIGCVASYKKQEIMQRYSFVDFVFGSKEDLIGLQKLLSNFVSKMEPVGQPFAKKAKDEQMLLGGFKECSNKFSQSLVNIMTGCNNYCSYCIVPFTRGREKSYLMTEILDRIKRDVCKGAKEVILIGQNVNSYKDPQSGIGFVKLLEHVAQVEGDFWVRFLSPHPKDMSIDVLQVMATYPEKLCAFIHHPLQSGSNKILKAMNRTYEVEKYLEQIKWVKKILPHATISTDIIVGFPGETQEDYLQTRQVLEQVKFDNVFSFVYSPRKYTKAALFEDDCLQEVKLKRLDALQKRQVEICKQKNSLNIGKVLKSLVEKRLTNGKLLSRTEGNVRVLFEGDEKLIGQFVKLKIDRAGAVNMFGSLIDKI